MSLRRAGCVIVSCALLFNPMGLHAQKPSNSFGEVFEVRVTNVDVVAVDSKGNPVEGLTQSDFEVYEDGKRQEITNFSEMTAATTEAAAPQGAKAPSQSSPGRPRRERSFIFYVDNGSLSLKNRSDIFSAVNQFLATSLLPGDQAMVVNWNGSLHVRLPWTTDRAAIEATLKALGGELGNAGLIQAEKQRTIRLLRQLEAQSRDPTNMVTYEMVEAQVRSYAENARHDINQSVNALTKLLATLSGVEGRKILILATESLPTHAGAEVFQAYDNIRQRAVLTPEPATNIASGATPSPGTTLSAGSRRATPIGDLGKYNVSPMIEALARAANATGVTVYSINPKGTDNNAAGKADLQDATEVNIDFAQSAQILDGANMLTRRTGGVAMIGMPATAAFARLTQDLGSYYSIGYRSRPGKSPDRKIEVRVKRPGVNARYRNSIYYRSLATVMSDRVLANHLQTPSQIPNELGIALQADPVTTDGGKRLLPIRVIISADSLTLIPDAEGNMTGGFSVFTSAGNADVGGAGINMQSQEIKWPAAQAAQMKGRRIGFAIQVPMDKNPAQVSVGVVDHVSQTEGFAMIKVVSNGS